MLVHLLRLTVHQARTQSIGEETYSDTKFYWKNIEPQHVIKALMRDRSDTIGEDDISHELIMMAVPGVLPAVTHFNM